MSDLYAILGVSADAPAEEIKKAYRKLAKELHPDLHPGDAEAEAKFKEVTAAYEILGDPTKRQAYDHPPVMPDFLEGFFSRGSRAKRPPGPPPPQPGANLQVMVALRLGEAIFGCEKQVEYSNQIHCSTCQGYPAKDFETCSVCQGSGMERRQQGAMLMQSTCRTCHGLGSAPKTLCEACQGSGYQREVQNVTLTIPANVEKGQRFVLQHRGGAGLYGGPSGVLVVFLDVQPPDLSKLTEEQRQILREI